MFTSRISFTWRIVISLVLDICGLFKIVFDCLLVVVDVFEVVVELFEAVVGGFRSFLLLVTTRGRNHEQYL